MRTLLVVLASAVTFLVVVVVASLLIGGAGLMPSFGDLLVIGALGLASATAVGYLMSKRHQRR